MVKIFAVCANTEGGVKYVNYSMFLRVYDRHSKSKGKVFECHFLIKTFTVILLAESQ